ncbi:hypothetical protein [Absidia glauca]|uniref:Uncharacterized protein n=1 Tax=Absidia glauca TaxID=4829 RepID=A0A168L345_ABSGL|nr:hypothetical protein [Absidia glauca]
MTDHSLLERQQDLDITKVNSGTNVNRESSSYCLHICDEHVVIDRLLTLFLSFCLSLCLSTSLCFVVQHLESLKTRLGFARFKLRNGWENNTLLDVESLWKERQRQMIDALPTPRFTQRDILDNRTLHPHYHYRPSINGLSTTTPPFISKKRSQHERRHSYQQEQKKKAKLTRSFSTPTTSDSSFLQPKEQYTSPSSSSPLSSSALPPSPYSGYHYDNSKDGLSDSEEYHHQHHHHYHHHHHHINATTPDYKRLITHTPPSPPADKDTLHHSATAPTHLITPPRGIRSSLDYLSYAIAMTENQPIGGGVHLGFENKGDLQPLGFRVPILAADYKLFLGNATDRTIRTEPTCVS